MLKRAWLEKRRSNTVVVPALLVLGGLQTLAETIGTSTAKPVLNLNLWHRGNKKSRCLKRRGGQGGPTNSRPISQPYQETASTGTNIADQIPRLFWGREAMTHKRELRTLMDSIGPWWIKSFSECHKCHFSVSNPATLAQLALVFVPPIHFPTLQGRG